MALTPEQVKKYREAYGFDTPTGAQPTATDPAQKAQERIASLKAADTAPTTTEAPNVAPQGTQPQPAPIAEAPKSVFGKVFDFGKGIVKDAAETLLVKPAARVAEAVGRTGMLGDTIKKGYEVMNDEGGQNLSTPIGDYKIDAVKTGVAGAKQIAGEGLKSASYLYGGQGAGKVAQKLALGKTGSAVLTGALTGGASGAAYGGGQALEENKSAGEVAKEALIGGAIGTIAGGTIAATPAVVRGTKDVVKGVFGGAKRAVGALDEAGVRAAEVAAKTPAAQKAVRAGVDDTVINFVETATPADRAAFPRLMDLAEQGAKDMRIGREQLAKREAAKPILDRVAHIIKAKDVSVGQSNKILNSLDQSPVDVSNLLYSFLDDLKNKGIIVTKRGNGYQMTTHGAVPEGDLGAYKSMLQILAPDENGAVMRSYRGLHTARQRIFNELNLAKARQQTFSDDVVRYADHYRSMLLDPIDKASKGKYKVAQQKTAESLGALRDFVKLIGYKGDLEKITTKDLKAAEVAKRVLGNAADVPTTVLQALDDIAHKYGYKGNTNMLDQVHFVNLLEDVFGTTQSGSLRGQVGRGALDAASEATGAVHEAASGNILALGSRAVKAVIGKSKDDQIRALRELVDSLGRARTNFGK